MNKSSIQHFGLLNYPSYGLSSFVAPDAVISGNVEVGTDFIFRFPF